MTTHGDPSAWSKGLANDVDEALGAPKAPRVNRRTKTLAQTFGGEDREAAAAETLAAATREAVSGAIADSVAGHVSDDMAAAAEIRAWHLTLRTIGSAAEAAVMRACWRIRQAHPDTEEFGRFVFNELGGCMTPRKAWLLADTWEVARKNRKVHELAASQPDKAVAFVRDFTDAVAAVDGDETLPLPLDEDDKEVVALLTAPPKKRRAKLRELVAARRAPRDRHPDDVERIRELEAEREERSRADAANATKATRAELLRTYREAAVLLGEVASKVVATLDGEKLAEHSRKHLEMSNDIAVGGIEAVVRLTFEEDK